MPELMIRFYTYHYFFSFGFTNRKSKKNIYFNPSLLNDTINHVWVIGWIKKQTAKPILRLQTSVTNLTKVNELTLLISIYISF